MAGARRDAKPVRTSDVSAAPHLPRLLSIDDVANWLIVPKQTVYDWSSRGLLDSCKVHVGRYVRFREDHLIELVFSGGLSGHEK